MVAHSSLFTEVVFIVFHFVAGAKVYACMQFPFMDTFPSMTRVLGRVLS